MSSWSSVLIRSFTMASVRLSLYASLSASSVFFTCSSTWTSAAALASAWAWALNSSSLAHEQSKRQQLQCDFMEKINTILRSSTTKVLTVAAVPASSGWSPPPGLSASPLWFSASTPAPELQEKQAELRVKHIKCEGRKTILSNLLWTFGNWTFHPHTKQFLGYRSWSFCKTSSRAKVFRKLPFTLSCTQGTVVPLKSWCDVWLTWLESWHMRINVTIFKEKNTFCG